MLHSRRLPACTSKVFALAMSIPAEVIFYEKEISNPAPFREAGRRTQKTQGRKRHQTSPRGEHWHNCSLHIVLLES